jgi:hypothetical protein
MFETHTITSSIPIIRENTHLGFPIGPERFAVAMATKNVNVHRLCMKNDTQVDEM